jgi:hypothetical protein
VKPCKRCGTTRPLADFPKDRTRQDGTTNICRKCRKVDAVRHYAKKLYGISLRDYEQMLRDQRGVCAVCHQTNADPTKSLSIDHDHRTGRVRALLCQPCNMAIGLMKDSADRLRAAAAYLDQHEPSHRKT